MADGDGARPPAAAPIRLPTAAEVEQAVLGVGRKRTNLFQAGAAARPPPVFPFTSSHPPPAPPPAPTTALLPPAAPVAAPAPAPAAAAAPAAPPAPPAGGVRPPSRPASPADGPAVTSGSVAAAAGPAVGDRRVPYIPKNPHSILVSARQKGNPVLRHIRNVPWEYAPVLPDYVLGASTCALFLSLRYHRLHPEYVHDRVRELRQEYNLRILLCLVDIDDHAKVLVELSKLAIINNYTMVLAWSSEEAGRYLETFKAYEHKPADIIKGRVNPDYMSQLTDCLTSIRSVNKTDVVTLASTFGSLKRIMEASTLELSLCPGIGEAKAKRIHDAFHDPFIAEKSRRLAGPDAGGQA